MKNSGKANGLAILSSGGEVTQADSESMPSLVSGSGSAARFAWQEFIHADIRNAHTRKSYRNAVRQFLAWCGKRGLTLTGITPRDVGEYLDRHPGAISSKKVHLAALRSFFDRMVVRHAIILNPAASVRAERYTVVEGKTPEISIEQARRLIASIDVTSVVGLRDRAIISILAFTAARIGAIAKLQVQHFYDAGDQWMLHFDEKGGKSREIPVRHDLRQVLLDYMGAAAIGGSAKDDPLFRTAIRKEKRLTDSPMSANDMGRMFKRRLKDAGLPNRLSPHSLRVAVITDLLDQNVPLEDVQYLVGHADPRTTRLYDRRHKRVTRNIVERISI